MTESPRVAIVGFGMGGIALSVYLKRAGLLNFSVFEAEDGPGGTWYVNRYPGANVDIESIGYSFSFLRHNWRRTHASQEELLAYLKDVVYEFDLERHVQYGMKIDEVRWDDLAQHYVLTTSTGHTHQADVVVSSVGFLNDPRVPQWEGIEGFAGELIHSAKWEPDLDLTDKRVAVVGTGSTAAQIVPALAPQVAHLTLFQREPGWVLPKGERDYTVAELARHTGRLNHRWRRFRFFVKFQLLFTGGKVYNEGSKAARAAESRSLAFVEEVFKGRPDLKKAVTPTYAFSGKRRVVSDDYYPSLLRPNVELVPHSVERLATDGVIDAQGVKREVDVIVAATGFHASEYLSRLRVFGRQGVDIHEVWSKGAFAFIGMGVPGFPNFYMTYGPGTNGGAPITFNSELQAKYIVRNIKRMMRGDFVELEVRPRYVRLFNRWLDWRNSKTVWVQANNYMKGPTGRIVTQWPDDMLTMRLMLWALRRPATRGVRARGR